MNRSEFLKSMQQKLTAKRDALMASVTSELSELRHEDGTTSANEAGDTIDNECQELNSRLAERTSEELQQINAALGRLRAEKYGECEGCGREIPLTRLKALPFATHCVYCQSQREYSNRHADEFHAHRWPSLSSDYTTEDLDTFEEELSRNPIMDCRVLQVV